MGKRLENLTNQRFGRLLVVDFSGRDKQGKPIWQCLCDCGKQTHVRAAVLKRGDTKSCGCFSRERAADTVRQLHHPPCGFCKCGSRLAADNCHLSVFERQSGFCNSCDAIYQKHYYQNNATKRRKMAASYKRKKMTGVTQEEFENRINQQNGLCMICGRPLKLGKSGQRPCQDHDHKTGKARDVICGRCNSLLGMCDDNKKILASAIEYLQKHGSSSTN